MVFKIIKICLCGVTFNCFFCYTLRIICHVQHIDFKYGSIKERRKPAKYQQNIIAPTKLPCQAASINNLVKMILTSNLNVAIFWINRGAEAAKAIL